MLKKVRFEYGFKDETERRIIHTILLEGYPVDGVFNQLESASDGYVTFNVNRNDLTDLRHEVEVLVKAGIQIREAKAL